MAARRHGSQGEGQAKGTFLLPLLTSNESSHCLRTHEVLIVMWLVTALAFSAPALQAGEQQSKGKEMVLSSRGCFSGLYSAELLPVTLTGNSDLSARQTVYSTDVESPGFSKPAQLSQLAMIQLRGYIVPEKKVY